MTEVYGLSHCLFCGQATGGTSITRDLDEEGQARLRFEPFRLPHSESDCARFSRLQREEWPHQAT